MNPLERAADREARRLKSLDRATLREIRGMYEAAAGSLRENLAAVTSLITAARDAGETVNPQWLYRQQRYESLLFDLERELDSFYAQTAGVIVRSKTEALTMALEAAPDLTVAALGPGPTDGKQWIRGVFNRVNIGALRAMVDRARDGTPLGRLLAEVTGPAVTKVRDALVSGVAAGRGVREIARDVRKASMMPLRRSLLIARQEVIGAYRDASSEAYQQSGVVTKWVWHSALDVRTCPVCWAQHGKEYPDDEKLESHIACRCTQVPKPLSWAELGFDGIPDNRPEIESGIDVFDRLPETDQRKILGPTKFEAYKRGELQLPDLVKRTRSERWGGGLREASARELDLSKQ